MTTFGTLWQRLRLTAKQAFQSKPLNLQGLTPVQLPN